MNTILSIDPSGSPTGTTGVVLIGYDDITPAHALASWAVQGGVEPFREWTHTHLSDGDIRYETDTLSSEPWWHFIHYVSDYDVICEKFVPRNIPGADYTPLVMEGVIQWIWPNVIWSPASGKDKSVPNEVLKRLGLYDFGTDHHYDRREASRHAVRWLKNERHVPTLKAGWAPNAR